MHRLVCNLSMSLHIIILVIITYLCPLDQMNQDQALTFQTFRGDWMALIAPIKANLQMFMFGMQCIARYQTGKVLYDNAAES